MKKPINKITHVLIFNLLLLMGFWHQSHAQYAVRASMIKPSASFGMEFKPGLAIEVNKLISETDHVKWGVSIGFFKLNNRHDTLSTYGLMGSSAEDYQLIPGYITESKFWSIPVGLNFDYKVLEGKISPILGADLYLYMINYSYSKTIEGIIDESFSGGVLSAGFLPRVGVSYEHDETFTFLSGIGKSFNLKEKNMGASSFWKTYLTVRYYF